MYAVKTPWWLRKMYAPSLTWKMPAAYNKIYITFDDGPHPEITPFVLGCLQQYNAKATFFCIGKNVQAHPAIYNRIMDQGHSTGNHTQDHLNGWKVTNQAYVDNVMLAKNHIDSNLFRPPYGRISRYQANQLKPMFNIIMWDVLSGDFDVTLSPKKCLHNVLTNTTAGSIIVFHNSEKALPRLQYALPEALKIFAEKEFVMSSIENTFPKSH